MSQWWFSLPKEQRLIIIVLSHAFGLGSGIFAIGPVVIIYYVLGFALAAVLYSLDQED